MHHKHVRDIAAENRVQQARRQELQRKGEERHQEQEGPLSTLVTPSSSPLGVFARDPAALFANDQEKLGEL